MKTKTHLLLASVVVFSAALSAAASQETINRELSARPGGKLVVDVDFGNINVSPGTDDKVVVEAFRLIEFGNEAKEKEYLASAPVTITADGNTVSVRAHAPEETRHPWTHHVRMDARYTIRVPKNFSAELNTGGGAINALQIAGDLRANSGGGDLRFSRLRGALSAQSGGGAIKLEDCNGGLDISTGGGDIVFTGGTGNLRVRTGGGRIQVRDFTGDTQVGTGGGDLTFEKVDGALTGETSGGSIRASVMTAALKPITLETAGGDIDLALPKTAAAEITADTASGRITCNLPLEATQIEEEHLRARLNGGGPAIRLRTAGGSIRIDSAGDTTAAR